MPVLPPNPAVNSTAGDIIKDALYEIGVLAQGEELSADDAVFCMRKLNRLLDSMNSRSGMIFNVNFSRYTLIPNLQPHTIGPGGTFDVDPRPIKLCAANLVLTTSNPNVLMPMGIRDDAWWADNRVQALTSTYPTDVYYSPDWPLGSLFFWPVPTTAYDVQLETWVNFTAVRDLTDAFTYPQGYWDAIVYTLAVTLCPGFQVTPSQILLAAQTKAWSGVMQNNNQPPRISLSDSGMPGRGRRGHFDWRTGGINV